MKGRNWRDYEPEEKRRQPRNYEYAKPRIEQKKKQTTTVLSSTEVRTTKNTKKNHARNKSRSHKKLAFKFLWILLLLVIGYFGFEYYYFNSKPYTIAIDLGHGGSDPGAEGLIGEVELIENTTEALTNLLEEDGRFRVVLSRQYGESESISNRNEKFKKLKPDLMISIHGNASDDSSAYGFECYPSPPGALNHEISMDFASYITAEMGSLGARLRGINGIRFGYYIPIEGSNNQVEKMLVDSTDTKVYEFDTFGVLKNMDCPSILIEQCFITNQHDFENFGSDTGSLQCAQAYYIAITKYLESLDIQ